jgi:molybdenum cofactor synthesis domain-containing protein
VSDEAPSVAVVTVSSSVAVGDSEDATGPLLVELVEELDFPVVAVEVVADERAAIEACLRRLVRERVGVILTAGGTGLSGADVTPEATLAVIDREVPGLAEALRADARQYTPMGALSRGVCGIAGESLIVNLPGSPRAVAPSFGVLAPVLAHAAATLRASGSTRHLHDGVVAGEDGS